MIFFRQLMPSEAFSDGIYFEVLVVFASDILMV
uniref:Uncharacterized protein n=1 Tax=Neisseria meningitidis alpha153 TaxID=663926 RepID=C6SEZ2_NEIME|nr:hypothetical protein predicted by Glimmer/Critica [Neisseria meningitidis alpha153]